MDWKFAVSSADAAPQSAPILLQGSICENLVKAANLGYHAIEVHTRENVELDYKEIEKTSKECGAKVCMIITGRLNTEGQGNLIDDRRYVVDSTMDGMRQYIDMAQKLGADIVIGWVKGNIPAGVDRGKYLKRLAGNLRILSKYGKERGVKLNLEVINHYEVNIFTTAQETLSFIEDYNLDNCYVHLDSFHMGLEECNPLDAIRLCKDKIGYVHVADSTRRYPGSGQFDFPKILHTLEEVGYQGYVSVECFPYPDGQTAAKNAIEFLKNC